MYAMERKLRVPDAAHYLGLATSTLAKLRLRGNGPVYSKMGRIILYEKADLDNWVAANRRTSTSDQPDKPLTVEDLSDSEKIQMKHV